MTEERVLRICRAAERAIVAGYRWMPYASDLTDAGRQADLRRDEDTVIAGLGEVRKALTETEAAILNIAEHKGSRP